MNFETEICLAILDAPKADRPRGWRKRVRRHLRDLANEEARESNASTRLWNELSAAKEVMRDVVTREINRIARQSPSRQVTWTADSDIGNMLRVLGVHSLWVNDEVLHALAPRVLLYPDSAPPVAAAIDLRAGWHVNGAAVPEKNISIRTQDDGTVVSTVTVTPLSRDGGDQ